MEKEDIAFAIHDTILNFPKRIEKPRVEFLSKKRFSKMLDLMDLNKHVDKTPCFTVQTHDGKHTLYACEEIIQQLTKNISDEKKKKFVEAITLHELLHIWNHLHVHTADEATFSEQLVAKELKNFYPSHFIVLEEYKRR
ncbi:MAG TPA: hypothetical protein VJJ79_02620 [Candidatus Nanoarchaeia archaeon]|nr:hypothetical protein [Candidatus Nanoarchaeia archaeon]